MNIELQHLMGRLHHIFLGKSYDSRPAPPFLDWGCEKPY